MGKYDHLVVYQPRPEIPGKETDPSIMKKIVFMDTSVMQGMPYFEIMWFVKPREPRPPEHTHDFDEFIGFIGSNPDDPSDLGATVNFKIEDEWLVIKKSALLYIPAGLRHSPFVIEDMKRPILHFSGGPSVQYFK